MISVLSRPSLIEAALWRDSLTPYSAIERSIESGFGQAEARACLCFRDVNGSLERGGHRLRARVVAAQPTGLQPAELTCNERHFISDSDWLGDQPTLLPGQADIADLNQGWLRSCAALKPPLRRSFVAGTAQGSSCNRSWRAGAIESVEECGWLLVGWCQSQSPLAPTEATRGTCCTVVDSSGTAPEHQHRAIV